MCFDIHLLKARFPFSLPFRRPTVHFTKLCIASTVQQGSNLGCTGTPCTLLLNSKAERGRGDDLSSEHSKKDLPSRACRVCNEEVTVQAGGAAASHRDWPRASRQHPGLRKSDGRKIPQYQRSQCSICCYLEPLNCLEANTLWTDTLVLNQQKCRIHSSHSILSIYSEFSGFKLLILALTQIKSWVKKLFVSFRELIRG